MQPDYILAQAGETRKFKGVGFHFLRFLHSDHCVVVAVVRAGGDGWLKTFWHKRQKFPLSLLLGPKDKDMAAFNTLTAECVGPKPKQKLGKDWMSNARWRLIAKQASLLWSCCIRQDTAHRMKCKIKASIKADKQKLTAKVGNSIVMELAKGEVQEAFRLLKGWYRKAAEMQARPCRQTMEGQTDKQEELYGERAAYGAAFPANGVPYAIGNNQLIESKLWAAVSLLSHEQCGGTLGIRAEHIKAWLRGAKREEDPDTAASHVWAGKTWHKFAHLCSSVWNTGAIPQQMCWVITVLIPKGVGGIMALDCSSRFGKCLRR